MTGWHNLLAETWVDDEPCDLTPQLRDEGWVPAREFYNDPGKWKSEVGRSNSRRIHDAWPFAKLMARPAAVLMLGTRTPSSYRALSIDDYAVRVSSGFGPTARMLREPESRSYYPREFSDALFRLLQSTAQRSQSTHLQQEISISAQRMAARTVGTTVATWATTQTQTAYKAAELGTSFLREFKNYLGRNRGEQPYGELSIMPNGDHGNVFWLMDVSCLRDPEKKSFCAGCPLKINDLDAESTRNLWESAANGLPMGSPTLGRQTPVRALELSARL